MRRRSSLTGIIVVILILLAALGSTAVAADPSPMATAGDPLVGAWVLDTNAQDPTNPSSLAIFHADGTYVQTDPSGTGVGAWQSTGPGSADLIIRFEATDDQGAVSMTIVRAAVEAAGDGQSLTATFTLEFIGPDGTSSGQLGPVTATGTRLAVEPMGTPVGPLAPPAGPAAGATPPASMAPGGSPAG